MENKNQRKHLIKYTNNGEKRRKTVLADSIYSAERILRKELHLSEMSSALYIRTIKVGLTEYQVYGTTLG